MGVIVGLDLSLTATGWARRERSAGLYLYEVGTIASLAKGVERLIEIRDKVLQVIGNADLVVVEGYSYGSKNRAHQLGELGGVIRVALSEKHVTWFEVAPKFLKKYAAGKGNAPKPLVLTEAVRRLNYEGADDNQADALWLATAAADRLGWYDEAPVPKAQRETLMNLPIRALESL